MMPTINVKKTDLERLINMPLEDEFIEEKFPMMGVEVEEIFEEELPKNLNKKTQEKILTEIEKVFIKYQKQLIDEVQELLENIKI